MTEIEIRVNEADQRLDRFLRKYLKGAPLSYIYKIIRKDVKINGARAKTDTMLVCGDRIRLYIKDEEIQRYRPKPAQRTNVKRSFAVAYEDDNILAVEKPFGLLTHGDGQEKKNTLVNQVIDYLIEKGEYIPRIEKSFSPAAVNRLDRNTTGLVLFGKNSAALRLLNEMIKDKESIEKYYLTIICGELKNEIRLKGSLRKDERRNRVKVSLSVPDAENGLEQRCDGMDEYGGKDKVKYIETKARPILYRNGYTLTEVRLLTGRSHQIRAHLAAAGYPVLGDGKYGNASENKKISEKYGLTTQFLHAYRLRFNHVEDFLSYLNDTEITAALSGMQKEIVEELFGRGYLF